MMYTTINEWKQFLERNKLSKSMINKVANESVDQEKEDADYKILTDSLSAYFLDNYSKDDLKNIVNYKSRIGDDKGNIPLKLYRGIFFNGLTAEQLAKLTHDGTFMDNNISWTKSLQVAKYFAKGTNVYDTTDPDELTLSPGQVGIILVHTFNPDDVIIDVNYAVDSAVYYEINDSTDDEKEVLVYPKNIPYKIFKIYR